jgi:hypothetical protein
MKCVAFAEHRIHILFILLVTDSDKALGVFM